MRHWQGHVRYNPDSERTPSYQYERTEAIGELAAGTRDAEGLKLVAEAARGGLKVLPSFSPSSMSS